MANTLITKNSSTAAAIPTAGQLVQGELAVNVTDKRVFTENAAGAVVELGVNPSSLTLASGTANGVTYLNGSKVLTSGSSLTFDGTNRRLDILSTGLSGSDKTIFQITDGVNTTFQINQTTSYNQLVSNNALSFSNGSTEQMRLTSTGLGIGTSSPTQKLTVVNSNGTYGVAYQPAVQIGNTSSGGTVSANTGLGALVWSTDGTATPVASIEAIRENPGAGAASGLAFRTGSSGGGTTKAILDSAGNLGLGVTPSAWRSGERAFQVGSTTSLTDISKNSVVRSNHYVNSSNQEIYSTNGFANAFVMSSGGQYQFLTAPSGTAGNAISFTQAMTLDASGNLGIGITSPVSPLTVSKGLVTGAGQWASSAIAIYNPTNTGSYSQIAFGYTAGTNAAAYMGFVSTNQGAQGFGDLVFGTRAVNTDTQPTERVRITSAGLVGIGTSSPNHRLDVAGTANAVALGTTLAYGVSGEVYSSFRFNNSSFAGGNSEIRNIVKGSASTGSTLAFLTTQTGSGPLTERLRIDNSGNLLVGTTTNYNLRAIIAGPAVAASTGAGSYLVASLYDTNAGAQNVGGGIGFQGNDGANVGVTFASINGSKENATNGNYASYLSFKTRAHAASLVEAMRITSAGNVGIGTSLPTFAAGTGLQVKGAGFTSVRVTSGALVGTDFSHDASGGYVYVRDNLPLIIGTNNTERVRIDSSGNLLVGTTSTATPTTSTAYIYAGGLRINPNLNTASNAANLFWEASTGQFWRSTSSLRYKTNVQSYGGGLEKVAKLRPVTYNSINGPEPEKSFAGFIAEEVNDAGLIEFVEFDADGRPDSLAYANMVSLLTAAIQEQQAIIESLTARISALEGN